MSQPAPSNSEHDKESKGWLWMFAYGALFGIIAFVIGFALGALMSFSAGGEFIASQVLQQFGYTNASHAVNAAASLDLYAAMRLPLILALVAAGVGMVFGYFKGKNAV